MTPPKTKAGDDLHYVKKGSRLMPVVMLVIAAVSFVAFELRPPEQTLGLGTAISASDLPDHGRNHLVIFRLVGQEQTLHFRLFDDAQHQRDDLTDTAILEKAPQPAAAKAALDALRSRLDPLWTPNIGPLELPPETRDSICDLAFAFLDTSGVLDNGDYQHFFENRDFQRNAHDLATAFPAILKAQLKTLLVLVLYAIVPGLFGLIYRRAFGTWFAVAFVLLFVINRGCEAMGLELIAAERWTQPWTETFVQVVEAAIVLLLIAFRLRRHSVQEEATPHLLRDRLFAAALVALAGAGVFFLFGSAHRWLVLEGAAVLLTIAFIVVTQTRVKPPASHAKNIVVCLDGTWNEPGQKDFDHSAVTNVFKLFKMCKGGLSGGHHNASHCKVHRGEEGDAKQIAFYYRGVGNRIDNSALGELFGGAFGLGAEAIVERAYLDVVKAYRPGDRIFVFGFSRGAAIARLVAGAIGRRGVPKSLWTLRLFGRHWLLRKSAQSRPVQIEVLGCWDTVGSFGIAKNILGIPFQRMNLLRDLTVSLAVKRAYHMVALDETRDAFVPTLMEPDPTTPERIVEVWFSGNHSNVGGGYATDNLSDVALDFLLKGISSGYAWKSGQIPGDESWGLYLSAAAKGLNVQHTGSYVEIDPNHLGALRHSAGAVYSYAPRKLPVHAVVHDSVFERLREALPVYAPQSLFDLNQEFVKKRETIKREVEWLRKTESLDDQGSKDALEWGETHLSLTRWSEYVERSVGGAVTMGERLNHAVALENPPKSPAAVA